MLHLQWAPDGSGPVRRAAGDWDVLHGLIASAPSNPNTHTAARRQPAAPGPVAGTAAAVPAGPQSSGSARAGSPPLTATATAGPGAHAAASPGAGAGATARGVSPARAASPPARSSSSGISSSRSNPPRASSPQFSSPPMPAAGTSPFNYTGTAVAAGVAASQHAPIAYPPTQYQAPTHDQSAGQQEADGRLQPLGPPQGNPAQYGSLHGTPAQLQVNDGQGLHTHSQWAHPSSTDPWGSERLNTITAQELSAYGAGQQPASGQLSAAPPCPQQQGQGGTTAAGVPQVQQVQAEWADVEPQQQQQQQQQGRRPTVQAVFASQWGLAPAEQTPAAAESTGESGHS